MTCNRYTYRNRNGIFSCAGRYHDAGWRKGHGDPSGTVGLPVRICRGQFLSAETDGAGRMEQWAAATRKKIVPEQEMERRIGQSGLQILDKTRARIWDSSVVYYCLGKQKCQTEEDGI